MTRKVRNSKAAEIARRKVLGIGTVIARFGEWEGHEVTIPIEDLTEGDVVSFIGENLASATLAGWRLGTVMKFYPQKRAARLEGRITVASGERVFFKANVHETRFLENHGPRKREVL